MEESSGRLPISDNHGRILIAEDDISLAHFLKKGLQPGHYSIDLVHDGESALHAINANTCDLLILDLNLPKIDGLALLQQFRPAKPALPVLVLTARSLMEDRVSALDSGADDCLTKPFSLHELTARVRALMRRHGGVSTGRLQVSDLVLSRSTFRVERSGQRVDLTPKEFALLEYLMLNTGRPVTRAQIMESVWKTPYDAKTNLVDVYVKYVRDKIDSNAVPKLLRTIRGVGYVLAEQ